MSSLPSILLLTTTCVLWMPYSERQQDDAMLVSDGGANSWEFDFAGYRLLVETAERNEIERCIGLSIAEIKAPPNDFPAFRVLDCFDGVIWGARADHYAGQFYDVVKTAGPATDWSRFGSEAPPAEFPRGSFVFGRARDFLWHGATNSATAVGPSGENAHRPREASLSTYDRIVGFWLDFEYEFARTVEHSNSAGAPIERTTTAGPTTDWHRAS